MENRPMGTRTENAVVEMLKEDHEKVKGLFEEFKKTEGREKTEIAKTVIEELEVHADLEERLIYPAIREEIDADDMMNEAVEEHHLVHVLIAELKKLKPSDERFDAKFNVLGELVKHHIEEEEGEILPEAEKSNIDWDDLESRVMKRKEELMTKNASPSRKRR
jgi:hemerythrin-like domain-containing protein